ncbi:winged helix-turn-helix transcriptional regulator [Haloarcula sp. Atlit-120R]|uniref:winged helix-turn-helix transcriptional regulator n=1 Tax=Haloarcula sp. Atlit-120R TaxID=2282135 RepID=UPI000EF28D32|nr:winged helix-turn-helix transcriptional regulator [Haloarcula sp. Atlit-120R]RLM32789.1 winged helix-turn-helix transcriptional regulator [Haloarcula sp. Atlit-120R]
MKDAEKAVLKLLEDADIWLSASNIARNVGYSKGYVRSICKKFVQDGYLEIDETGGNPFYRITDAGREYLESE